MQIRAEVAARQEEEVRLSPRARGAWSEMEVVVAGGGSLMALLFVR